MPLSWDFFISREKLTGVIADLEGKRGNLRKIVNTEVIRAIKTKYPASNYKKIASQYKEEIIKIKDTLYSKFFEEINQHLRFFYSVRQDNMQADLQAV